MKTLEFMYQETQISFLVNGTDQNVMVNATEMAKLFGKRIDNFLKADHTKRFIKSLETSPNTPPNGGVLTQWKGRNGMYFDRRLALKFAAWLDSDLEVWIFSTMDEIIFGSYKKHWDAHARQEAAAQEMATLKNELITNGGTDAAVAYFEAERNHKNAGKAKTKAIRQQLSLFKD